ncbi:MAG: hypothetical protein IT291_06275 [Deltaproteobacteria bacterium]|nr:hypothetical protein [Deltaproteobacteria bacterium]
MTQETEHEQILTETEVSMLTTTLGDLICAISDAAKEAMVGEEDLAKITQIILTHILNRKA